MKKPINIKNAPTPVGPYSQGILINDTLYTAGQVAVDPATGKLITINITRETNQVMHNLMNILKEADMDFSNVVKTTIFLKDMNDFAPMNEVYATYFTDAFPARETVQVVKLPLDANIEISMVAVR